MASISKFYLLDATSPNLGTMPSAVMGGSGDIAGANVARDATDVIGTAQVSTTVTSNAVTTAQNWGIRRFVSRPLASQSFAIADGNWTFSYARAESNLNMNATIVANVFLWRPSTGLRIGTNGVNFNGTEPSSAGAQQAESVTAAWNGSTTILDGDILYFLLLSFETQSKASVFTNNFFYNGTTEASVTNCASFITPPTPLILQGIPVVGMALTVT